MKRQEIYGKNVWMTEGNAALDMGFGAASQPDLPVSGTKRGRGEKVLYVVGACEGRADTPDVMYAGNAADITETADAGNAADAAEMAELSFAGKAMCAMAALLEEALLFFATGIRVDMTPGVTTLFVWVLLTVITAGIVREMDSRRPSDD